MSGHDTDDGFHHKSKAFLHWLQQNGTTFSPKIELADLRYRDAGRGVLARGDIGEDEELFSIPRSSILTVETSILPADVKEQVDDPWLSLITAMIYEYQRGGESIWKAYFDVLPSHFDTLMFWADHELEHLEASAVVQKIGKRSADDAFKHEVIPVLKQHTDAFKLNDLSEAELLALCHRMGSTIMAYAFDLEKPGSGTSNNEEDGWEEDEEESETLPKGMVPLADMLNADADRNNAKLYYEDDKVVMKSIKPIAAGEEIFNDYGPLPTADVLRRYGYITGNYEKYDVMEISLDLIQQTAGEQHKQQSPDWKERTDYLDEQGILDTAYDITHASNTDIQQFADELCMLLNTLTLPNADFDKLKKKEKLPKPALSQIALNLLYSILVRRRAMYKSDTTDDFHKSLDHSTTSAAIPSVADLSIELDTHTASHRRMMARAVVEGEKKVLHEAAETVQEMLKGGSEGKKRKADTFEEEAKCGAQKKQMAQRKM